MIQKISLVVDKKNETITYAGMRNKLKQWKISN
jgi:hypothetical protein